MIGDFFDHSTSGVLELRTSNFKRKHNKIYLIHPNIKNKNGIIMFYVTWCSKSRDLRNVWSDMAHTGGKMFPFMAVNCEHHRGITRALRIQGYPTLIFVHKNGLLSYYNGGRTLGDLNDFMCYVLTNDIDTSSRETSSYLRLPKNTQNNTKKSIQKNTQKHIQKNTIVPTQNSFNPRVLCTNIYQKVVSKIRKAHTLNTSTALNSDDIKYPKFHKISEYKETNPFKCEKNPRPQYLGYHSNHKFIIPKF